MARCNQCGAEATDLPKFCPSCGARFVPRPEPVAVDGESGAYYCFKHKKEITRVTCGRCDKPICTRCIVISPAGTRCKQCASHKTPTRIRGVVHDVAHRVGPMDGKKVWYLYIVSMIVRLFTGWFR